MLLHLKVPFYCTVNPLLSPPGDLLIASPFEGEGGGNLIETSTLFNLEKTMVSVLRSKIKYTVKAKDQNQFRTSTW